MADAERKAKPRGRAIRWPGLNRLARITPDDVSKARRSWLRHAPAAFRTLLDAIPFRRRRAR